MDVVVAGAGPAGATLARLLALRGLRVTVVDPATSATDRLEILAPSSGPVVEALDLTGLLEDPSIGRPCSGIRRSWGAMGTEVDDFFRHRGGRGFVVDRARFDARLRAMGTAAGASFIEGRVIGARRRNAAIEAQIKTKSEEVMISATVAVDATGRSCVVARNLGARRVLVERLIAERRLLDRSRGPCEEPTWLDVEGAKDRWSYAISGPDGRRDEWVVYRGDDLPRVAGGKRANASSACLSHSAGVGWLAVGDAAASFDPIASQGLVSALTTALVAAGAILSSRGFAKAAASAYSEVVAATFRNSERGRAAVYGALEARGSRTRLMVDYTSAIEHITP